VTTDPRQTLSESARRATLARIGAFELDLTSAELRRAGRQVALTGQPMRVLILLVERAGTIVTRDELRQEIWGETHVDFEAGLSTCINQIRTALGDRAAAPVFIETLPRRGYRFVAPVEWLSDATPQAATVADVPPARVPRGKSPLSTAVVLASLAVALVSIAVASWSIRKTPARAAMPLMVLPVIVDPVRSDLEPVSRTLNDALIGALATEAGDRARLVSPLVTRQLVDTSWEKIQQAGIEYVVLVTLRTVGRDRFIGEEVLVHVKLIGRDGLVTWTSDRVMTIDELERGPLPLADALSKSLMRQIANPRAG